jgi:signal transduction histidine kinase
LIASKISDYCVIYLKSEEGHPIFLEAAHVEEQKKKELTDISARIPISQLSPVLSRIMKSGTSELRSDVTEQTLTEEIPTPETRDFWIREKIRSSMSVALIIRGKVLGTVHFISTNRYRRYDSHDLEFAEEICHRISLAIGNTFLYDEAQKAARVREEFILVAAHELRTPLTPILMTIQTLEKIFRKDPTGQIPKEEILKTFAIARYRLDGLVHLVESMIEATRMAMGQFQLQLESVELEKLVHQTISEFQSQIEKAECRVEVSSHGPTRGRWDPARLKEAIIRLLENAIKFGACKPIQISLRGDQQYVEISIRDFGIGIAYENLKRIFGPFERAVSPQHFGGLGLGLFISNEIIKAHGGSISVESEAGKGSTFTVRLPLVTVQASEIV